MATMICHASIDENGKISGGAAGDQTGTEVCVREWYNKPWNLLLRYNDATTINKAITIAKKIANSNLVGYDQGDRNTLYRALKKHNFNVDSYIASKEKTEADCSSFMFAVWCCLIPNMRSNDNAPTTSTMRKTFVENGFTAYTDSAHVAGTANLQPGDVLVSTGHHTAMVVQTNSGSVAKSDTTSSQASYLGKVTASALNVRKGAGTNYGVNYTIYQNEVHTIIEEQNGWGRLKSGIGWVSLKYIKKV
jgi:hypothetical protein